MMAEMHATAANTINAGAQMLVSMRLGNQLFGMPVAYVRDVLKHQRVTPVPLAPQEIAGSLNLRGRIVTVIDLHKRLRLEAAGSENCMFVVIERRGELYSLMVEQVGEVVTVPAGAVEKPPAHLDKAWADLSSGIFKLEGELMVVMDIEALLGGLK